MARQSTVRVGGEKLASPISIKSCTPRLALPRAHALQFYAFDLLIYKGRSLLDVPLETRRELLKEAFKPVGEPISLSEVFDTAPSDLIRAAKEQALEGIIAKQKNSLYESGKRTGAWLKYRINRGQEFVIGGYTPGAQCTIDFVI